MKFEFGLRWYRYCNDDGRWSEPELQFSTDDGATWEAVEVYESTKCTREWGSD